MARLRHAEPAVVVTSSDQLQEHAGNVRRFGHRLGQPFGWLTVPVFHGRSGIQELVPARRKGGFGATKLLREPTRPARSSPRCSKLDNEAGLPGNDFREPARSEGIGRDVVRQRQLCSSASKVRQQLSPRLPISTREAAASSPPGVDEAPLDGRLGPWDPAHHGLWIASDWQEAPLLPSDGSARGDKRWRSRCSRVVDRRSVAQSLPSDGVCLRQLCASIAALSPTSRATRYLTVARRVCPTVSAACLYLERLSEGVRHCRKRNYRVDGALRAVVGGAAGCGLGCTGSFGGPLAGADAASAPPGERAFAAPSSYQ